MDTDERQVSAVSLLSSALHPLPLQRALALSEAHCHAHRLLAASVAADTGLSAVTYLFN